VTRHTDHFDGRRFFNPSGANGRPVWMVPRMLLTPRTRWPRRIPVEPRRPATLGPDDVVVTFVGHATFLIQVAAVNVLIDPVYAERASPVSFAGPRRVRAPGVRFDDLPTISVVLLSHNHYDHCDLGTLRALDRRFDMPLVAPIGNGPLLRSAGMRHVEEIDWWHTATTAPLPITLTPAQHFSARNMFDRNRALWGGFLIEALGRRILFAGDSGYGTHFREIAARLGPVDLALLPIGAYEPRWFMKDIHMSPAEAVQAHLDLAARQSIAMHFGTFQLTPEGIEDPVRELAKALQERGVPAQQFRKAEVGEAVSLARDPPASRA
jgi:L-ascorbate metabolism protein UlaG (beta-lactamase superfamily)